MSRSTLPYSWRDMLDSPDYSRAERNIVFEARDFQLNTGFIVPLFGLRSGGAVLSIAGYNAEITQQGRGEIHLAAIYAHARIRSLMRPLLMKRQISLTPRERECLRWAAAGKTDWEISEILSISEKTANAHIEHAKGKFDVATRVQAVVHAIRLGIIQP
jgi:LuxR family transcriptional regulator, quorum-sensing system regulator BjaR1